MSAGGIWSSYGGDVIFYVYGEEVPTPVMGISSWGSLTEGGERNTAFIIGELIDYNCTVTDVIDLYTWQVNMTFNPSIVHCTDAYANNDTDAGGIFAGHNEVFVILDINNIAGYVAVGSTLIGIDHVDGDGVLCTLRFEIMALGDSYLNYSEPYDSDTFYWILPLLPFHLWFTAMEIYMADIW